MKTILLAMIAALSLAVTPMATIGHPQRVTIVETDGGALRVGGDNSAGQVRPMRTDDAGFPLPREPWAGRYSAAGTLASTGTTNNATLQLSSAGNYLRCYCTAACYAGATATLNSDGGPPASIPSCLPADGGSIPADNCPPYAANERFYVDMRGSSANTLAMVSAAGAANAPCGALLGQE